MDNDDIEIAVIEWTNYVMFWVIILVVFALGFLMGWGLHP